jgi:hypothetical protein
MSEGTGFNCRLSKPSLGSEGTMYRDTQHRSGLCTSMISSAAVVLAILLNGLQRTHKNNLGPFESNKRSARADFACSSRYECLPQWRTPGE